MVMSHVHEVGFVMLVPLFILAFGAIFSGYFGAGYFSQKIFWGSSLIMPEEILGEHPRFIIEILPTLLGMSGIALTYLLYVWTFSWPLFFSEKFRFIYQLFFHKWYIDEFYDRMIVSKILGLGARFWQLGDIKLIDKWGPDGISRLVLRMSNRSSQLQTGYLFNYAYAMVWGVVGLVVWFILKSKIKGL